MLLPSELQASFDLQGPLALAARFSKRALPQRGVTALDASQRELQSKIAVRQHWKLH